MYWVASIGLCIWALAYAGLVYFSFASSSPETLNGLVQSGTIKQAYADYILAIPVWVRVLTVILAGLRLVGGAGLLMRQGWSMRVYACALGLTGVIMYRGFFVENVAVVIRPSQVLVEILFVAISAFAVWFAATNR